MKKDEIFTLMAGIVNLGSIVGLAAIGMKRNNDCYKAECKLIDEQLDNVNKDIEIMKLNRELYELKAKYDIQEEEA